MQSIKEKFGRSPSFKQPGRNEGLLTFWKNLCASELNQREKYAFQIVNQILYSKRLLVDHVDALELCLPYLAPIRPTEYFTFWNTSIVVISSLLHRIVTPRHFKFTLLPVSLFTGGFCSLYLAKKISDVRLKYIEREVDKLIQSFDVFGNCIKRNIMYFNEILVMKPKELIESRQIERAWDCITSVKEVIEILYDATRKLEENYKLTARYHEFYFPMEELRESEYFNKNVTDFTPKNIKDFYNIYSYVQSQFLLRLALTVSQYNKIPFVLEDLPEIQRLIQKHINEEDEHFVSLSLQLRAKQQLELSQIHEQQTCASKSGPVAVLKESSMKLSSCIIAVAEECQKLDVSLQKIDEIKFAKESSEIKVNDSSCFLDIANNMRTIENSLEMCYDDFKRLLIVYNKFLNVNLDTTESNNQITDGEGKLETKDEAAENLNNSKEEDIVRKDDFFAYVQEDDKDNESKTVEKSHDDYDFELINLEEKVTKGKFKPVLQQLKTKIDPIKKEMLEKERQVLQSKGIDLTKIIDLDSDKDKKNDEAERAENLKLQNSDSDADSEGSADELEKSSQRPKKDNYADMRNFLAQKQAINIFSKGGVPLSKHVDEDILE